MSEKKRRIMRSFTINEICLVGDSTQGGLRVPIMQRAEPLGESELRRRVQKLLEKCWLGCFMKTAGRWPRIGRLPPACIA